MLKLTKTGIGLLTKQYRSVLRKCLLLNFGVFALTAANTIIQQNAYALTEGTASGDRANAIGSDSVASGEGSIALAPATKAMGFGSTAVGLGARALVKDALGLGHDAFAYNVGSVALGSESVASEDYVISIGHLSTDLRWNDVAYGSNLFRRIVNVAAGTGDNDVVILKQLNDALNYYYTFRVDERDEAAEFALFLDNEKLSSVFEA